MAEPSRIISLRSPVVSGDSAILKFVYEEQRASGKIWQHFIAPDGNVYEIIGNDVAAWSDLKR